MRNRQASENVNLEEHSSPTKVLVEELSILRLVSLCGISNAFQKMNQLAAMHHLVQIQRSGVHRSNVVQEPNVPSEEITSGNAVVVVDPEFIQCLVNSTWQINLN